jgi:hypothetical protein
MKFYKYSCRIKWWCYSDDSVDIHDDDNKDDDDDGSDDDNDYDDDYYNEYSSWLYYHIAEKYSLHII